ncbi:hypothetical protein NPIL_201481 [Nephila pilipes]|uniref:Uncharacterized protein n=1 Tax=Nephila pilipes TaxID=299642 RepID=A0A8X6NBC0_NEPPI|nr:hypothetical protein NPIL_201481 [Nephila pilipes]
MIHPGILVKYQLQPNWSKLSTCEAITPNDRLLRRYWEGTVQTVEINVSPKRRRVKQTHRCYRGSSRGVATHASSWEDLYGRLR